MIISSPKNGNQKQHIGETHMIRKLKLTVTILALAMISGSALAQSAGLDYYVKSAAMSDYRSIKNAQNVVGVRNVFTSGWQPSNTGSFGTVVKIYDERASYNGTPSSLLPGWLGYSGSSGDRGQDIYWGRRDYAGGPIIVTKHQQTWTHNGLTTTFTHTGYQAALDWVNTSSDVIFGNSVWTYSYGQVGNITTDANPTWLQAKNVNVEFTLSGFLIPVNVDAWGENSGVNSPDIGVFQAFESYPNNPVGNGTYTMGVTLIAVPAQPGVVYLERFAPFSIQYTLPQ